MESELRNALQTLNLGQYIDVLQNNGFINWATLSNAGEEDLGRLGFKLGHRRRLQRELASRRNLPFCEPLGHAFPTTSTSAESK